MSRQRAGAIITRFSWRDCYGAVRGHGMPQHYFSRFTSWKQHSLHTQILRSERAGIDAVVVVLF